MQSQALATVKFVQILQNKPRSIFEHCLSFQSTFSQIQPEMKPVFHDIPIIVINKINFNCTWNVMPEVEETSMIVQEFNWSWHPAADVGIRFHNYRSKQAYHKWLKPGSFLYMSLTAALVTYKRKPEPQLSKQDTDALSAITDQVDATCRSSNYKDMYIDILETLMLWQEMDDC